MQRIITQQIKDRTLTTESLSRNASAREYQAHHHEWLEAAVRTGDVKFVDMLVRLFPMIVADHPDGFPCAYAFEQHNLPMLEGLLKAGAKMQNAHFVPGYKLTLSHYLIKFRTQFSYNFYKVWTQMRLFLCNHAAIIMTKFLKTTLII